MRKRAIDLASYGDFTATVPVPEMEVSFEHLQELETLAASISQENYVEVESVTSLADEIHRISHARLIAREDVAALESLLPDQYPVSSFTRYPSPTNYQVGMESLISRLIELLRNFFTSISNMIKRFIGWLTGRNLTTEREAKKDQQKHQQMFKEGVAVEKEATNSGVSYDKIVNVVKRNVPAQFNNVSNWRNLDHMLVLGTKEDLEELVNPRVTGAFNHGMSRYLDQTISATEKLLNSLSKGNVKDIQKEVAEYRALVGDFSFMTNVKDVGPSWPDYVSAHEALVRELNVPYTGPSVVRAAYEGLHSLHSSSELLYETTNINTVTKELEKQQRRFERLNVRSINETATDELQSIIKEVMEAQQHITSAITTAAKYIATTDMLYKRFSDSYTDYLSLWLAFIIERAET